MKPHLLNYTRYNLWANKKVCDFLLTIPQEQVNKEIPSSFPSLMKTLLHIWDAQFLWMKRLHGTSLSYFPSKDFTGTLEEAIQGVLDSSREFIAYVEEIQPEQLESPLTYKNVAGDQFTRFVRDIIQHVVNHSTYHRGQIITLLRQLDHTKLFSTDYNAFCGE